MRNLSLLSLLAFLLCFSCIDVTEEPSFLSSSFSQLKRYPNSVRIDSSYTYMGDSLYMSWLRNYQSPYSRGVRSLSVEDERFFNKQYVVKSSEAILLYGKNYIYPGAVLEGNSISNQKYVPIFLKDRLPITLSASLSHSTPKSTSYRIDNPTYSKYSDYVKNIVVDGVFQQNEKFLFHQKRFTFYDEIKSAFGADVNTTKLFSSQKTSSQQQSIKISKKTGLYIKFYQPSFTVNMDIQPLCDYPIKGKSDYEPVYVSSVTYGRMGVLVLETDEEASFAEASMKKVFSGIFSNGKEELSEQEKNFFENSEFKVLILGADSDYSVQSVRGYEHFLRFIYSAKFTPHSYGVPIACTFSYANTHELVETEFVSTVSIEPLFVYMNRQKNHENRDDSRNYSSSSQLYLEFYRDRERTITAIPLQDIKFTLLRHTREETCTPDYRHWPAISCERKNTTDTITLTNTEYKNRIFVGTEVHIRTSSGEPPRKPSDSRRPWRSYTYHIGYSLEDSPFFRIIR